MRGILTLLALFLLSSTAQAAQEAEIPPFPRALHLDPEVVLELSERGGVQYLKAPVAYVATLRARAEWSRSHWLLERQLRLDVTSALEKTNLQVKAAMKTGYEGRISLMREHVGVLEARAVADAKALDALRNPPWYRSKGFVYGLGVVTAVAAVGLGAAVTM